MSTNTALTIRLPDGGVIPRLGLGTWAIGGPWSAGGEAAGWSVTDDAVSVEAIRVGVSQGIRLFDTAQAYGAGHSERLLGEALASHPDVRIATKVGYVIDEEARALLRATTDADEIEASIAASRKRLRRDRIDIVLLHVNSLPVDEARPVFDRLEALRARGWIGHHGWSTDFPDRAAAMASAKDALPGFAVVEHAMNVFFAADAMGAQAEAHGLLPLIRSPLAMGLLGGRYGTDHRFAADDVRSRTMDWMDYFKDGTVTADHAAMLERLRAMLTSEGRSPAQGALNWLQARNSRLMPVPGFRTPAQVEDLCGALARGPFSAATMAAVESTLNRPAEGPPRER